MPLRILLADDSMTAQNMGKKILADGGYDVVTVSNGAAALKKLAEFTPDVIIADVYMPGYNGLEICERVKNAPATASVPVLLSVGKLEPFRPEEGMKVRADGIIIKPFEATDLLAVTAKLAERAGKRIMVVPPAPAPEPETAAATMDELLGDSAAPEPSWVSEQAAAIPAFAMEETFPMGATETAPFVSDTPAPASFELEDRRPDYVREFGLDPHDAPTTGFSVAREYATPAEAAYVVPLPELEIEPNAAFEARPQSVPASLNLAINEVSLLAPEEAPRAPDAPQDDFEAKLAAAMADYESTPAVEDEPDLSPAAASEHVAPVVTNAVAATPTWVAEEAPLSESEMALSLEEELRAFAASASFGSAPVAFIAPPPPTAPAGPLGDTSIDDEVAALVEQSREHYFPTPVATSAEIIETPATTDEIVAVEESPLAESLAADTDAAVIVAPAEEPVAEDVAQVGVADVEHVEAPDAEVSASTEILVDSTEVAPEIVFEGSSEVLPELTSDAVVEDAAEVPECALAQAAQQSETADAPPIAELITHDVPTDWAPQSAPAGMTPDVLPTEVLEVEGGELDEPLPTEDYVLTHHDFVSHEAPFAHAAVDEIAVEQPDAGEDEAVSLQLAEAVAPHITEQVASELAEQVAPEEAIASAPVLDEAAIADVVGRVMERMRGDIITQIARELAAKLGK